jgi:hypothetical protein
MLRAFALARICEAMALAAPKIAAELVQLSHATPARDVVHDARADEIWTTAAEPARHTEDADSFLAAARTTGR